MKENGLIHRCKWVNEKNEKYVRYHDEEWGVPSFDDRHLFEMLLLESFQAGLSWECILNKREDFKKAYDQFDYEKITRYDDKKIEELQANPAIVRNRLKIKASIENAQVFLAIQKEFGSFSSYLWHFSGNRIIENTNDCFQTTSPLSDKISADLKQRGMKFVGSTIIYSYLQAVGVINDHEVCCDFKKKQS